MYEPKTLPLWEQQVLAEVQLRTNANTLNGIDNTPLESDPKDALRAVYQGRGRARQDHGTRGQETTGSRDVRNSKRHDYRFKLSKTPSDDEIIGESLDSVVEPETPDWSDMDWLYHDIDITDGPAPIYYDGPYSPEKEAQRRAEAKIAADEAIMAKAESLLDKLNTRSIKPSDALQDLLSNTWGDERERLLVMLEGYLGINPYEGIDTQAEFGLIMGAGNLATRRTLDTSPFEDLDYLDGFHITKL